MPNVGNLILLDRQEYREFSLKRKQKKVEKKKKEKISLNKKRRKKRRKKKKVSFVSSTMEDAVA